MTIEQLSVVIKERINIRYMHYDEWHADIEGAEVKDGGILRSDFGIGRTPSEALADYARKISGKTLVFGAFCPDRKEIAAPALTTGDG